MKCPVCGGRGTGLPGQLCGMCGGAGQVPRPAGHPVPLVSFTIEGEDLYALDEDGRLWSWDGSGADPWVLLGNPREPAPTPPGGTDAGAR